MLGISGMDQPLAPALVIAGMHRSGTSLVASLVASAGVHIGDRLMGPERGNLKGHFEDFDFCELHLKALAANGLGWEGFTCETSIAMWVAYNRRVHAFLRAHPGRCLLVEASRAAHDPAGMIGDVGRLFGIELAAPGDLYDPTLLVEDDAFDSRRLVARVRPDAAELYDTLRGLAGGRHAAPCSLAPERRKKTVGERLAIESRRLVRQARGLVGLAGPTA